jgi:hypothetical protein
MEARGAHVEIREIRGEGVSRKMAAQAARELQSAIRSATGGGPAFKGARVTTTTVHSQLVIVPGGLGGATTVTMTGSIAEQLNLSGNHGEMQTQVYLSGESKPLPRLTSSQPSVNLTIGTTTHPIKLLTRPSTLIDAANKLQTAIRNAGSGAAFSNAQVTTLENQLLIVPGAAGNVTFGEVPGSDETTVAELQLHARYLVRVRVNGVESIDDIGVELPS